MPSNRSAVEESSEATLVEPNDLARQSLDARHRIRMREEPTLGHPETRSGLLRCEQPIRVGRRPPILRDGVGQCGHNCRVEVGGELARLTPEGQDDG